MFGRYCEGYLGRHFHAVRLSKGQRPDMAAIRDKNEVLSERRGDRPLPSPLFEGENLLGKILAECAGYVSR